MSVCMQYNHYYVHCTYMYNEAIYTNIGTKQSDMHKGQTLHTVVR